MEFIAPKAKMYVKGGVILPFVGMVLVLWVVMLNVNVPVPKAGARIMMEDAQWTLMNVQAIPTHVQGIHLSGVWILKEVSDVVLALQASLEMVISVTTSTNAWPKAIMEAAVWTHLWHATIVVEVGPVVPVLQDIRVMARPALSLDLAMYPMEDAIRWQFAFQLELQGWFNVIVDTVLLV
jgi:hypothetical protein